MRIAGLFLPALGGLLVACGSAPATTGDGASAGGAPGGGGSAGGTPDDIIAEVYVTTTKEMGFTGDRLDVELHPYTPVSPCAGATLTVGACCYFAPTPPPPLQTQGTGGGVATEASAGTITLVDTTTSATIATYPYANGGYASVPANYPASTWNVGDDLTVTATGGQIGAFSITAPALDPPLSIIPATVVRGEDLVVTWTPDPASQSMSIGLLDSGTGAVVACSVPEAAGTVTIDASLFASFTPGPGCQATAIRETDRFAATANGHVELASSGWASRWCKVE